ncbi:MAG: hypothetical protein ACI4QJ_08460 [Candidatus Spyradenecus sp.]
MKKMTYFAMLALAGLMVTGCASNQATNPVAEWQENRIMSTQIAAKKDAPLTITDVTYQSTLSNPALAAPINTFAIVPAGLYQQVVKGVDEMAAQQDGRLIYIGVQNDIQNGANYAELRTQMTPEEKSAYDAYAQAIAKVDQDSIMTTVVTPLLNQIATESVKVAALIDRVRNDPVFQTLAGFELMKESKNLAADGSALAKQFDDTLAGANLWMQLLQKDKEAKAFMKDYPTE